MALTPTTNPDQEAAPTKKKARRSESVSPSHYGPVACTSAASLVQVYLAVDPSTAAAASQTNGGKDGSSRGGSSSASRSAGDSCVLHLSQSRFDPVKRRFGGRSKPVSLPSLAVAAAAGGGTTSTGSSSRGARVSFGPSAKVVATTEAMHAKLHCRCVFVLLCEVPSEGATKSSAGTISASSHGKGGSVRGAAPSAHKKPARGKRPDTAHLITLSPDNLFLALAVDSFPVVVPADAESGGQGGCTRHMQALFSTSSLPRAFEIMDGPVVVHRLAARAGEPWRGLEVYRPRVASSDSQARTWAGQRIAAALPAGHAQGAAGAIGEGSGGDGSGSAGGGSGGKGKSLRLDLSAASVGDSDATPPSEDALRSKKRAPDSGGGAGTALLVCPPCASFSTTPAIDRFRCGRHGRGLDSGDHDETTTVATAAAIAAAAALPVVALPVVAASAAAAGTGVATSTPTWASLSVDRTGRASVSPWRGPPSGWRTSCSCLCRAPSMDSGVVGLAGASPGAVAGGGLVLTPPPATVYVGVADDRSGAESGVGGSGGGGGGGSGATATGGSLLELQGGGTLSCSRSLPAPPWAVMTAAVDDARGVLVVLLADPAATALLLARDGTEFPVVEEHRGVAAAFTGDFLGNGREQVALLPVVSSGSTAPGSGSGSSGGGGGRRAALAAKAGAGGWEQQPLKALVKRALVTDCSCIWGNSQRDDLAALPGAGPIQVGGSRPSLIGGGSASRSSGAAALGVSESTKGKGRKRQRPEGGNANTGKNAGATGSTATGSAGSGAGKGDQEADDHRLGRLSTVVNVLRRRVQAEETRLLKLRQARGSKAAALEAGKLALTALTRSAPGINGGDVPRDTSGALLQAAARTFYDGQRVPADTSTSTPSWIDASVVGTPPRSLRCAIARVQFHAPSRTLCLDARVTNPSETEKDAPERSAKAAACLAATKVCLSVASASGRLTTRSAVCPRLGPGESAAVRASVEVPLGLVAGEAATLHVSCMWCADSGAAGGDGNARLAGASENRGGRNHQSTTCCVIFARVLVSPQDMLGVGALALSPAEAPPPRPPEIAITAPSGRHQDATGSLGGDKNLGLFDVGTRLDLLMRSDTASLAALPQAMRSLSAIASLPEPWAGGAAASVSGCSERAAACTLRAGDSAGATAVLLRVAAGALPDGVRASADHASEQGRALIDAAVLALRDEIAAVEAVARARRGLVVTVGGESGAARALTEALERYTAAQMKSDVLAAQLAGRVVAARGDCAGRSKLY